MNIEYSEWRLANNYGDVIELNSGLKKYPKLERQILRHELGHSKNFSMNDLTHDLTENKVDFIQLTKY